MLDTGVLSAAENIALDEVLLETRANGISPNTFRFLQFSPPAVLVGYHQCVNQEVRVDYCKKNGIDINRRITGGGTIYFDKTQLGWEIISDKGFLNFDVPNDKIFERLSLPLIDALKKFGISACFRPRNDIEVNGRKISGTGGTEMKNAFLFQGTLLIDFDVDTMLRALRIPIEKLKRHEIESLKERVTCVKWEMASLPDISSIKSAIKNSFEQIFSVKLVQYGLLPEEKMLLEEKIKRFRSNQWIERVNFPDSEQPVIWISNHFSGGKVKVFFVVNLRQKSIKSATITGDFFIFPNRAIYDLEAILKDSPLDKEIIEKKITTFFSHYKPVIPGISLDDFLKIVKQLFEKLDLIKLNLPPSLINHLFVVNGTFEKILDERPEFLLLPYCAKSNECGLRYKNACEECNGCTVGEAYTLSHKYNLEPITITSFENLMETLNRFRRAHIKSYIGCCCEQFYIKHQEDFEKSGVAGILLDINSQTCYDLGKASFAYRGEFENQTALNIDLLKRVLSVL